MSILGTRVLRTEDPGFLTTGGVYTDDVVDERLAGGRIALANMGPVPIRATAAEQALAGGASVADAAGLAVEGTDPADDIHADQAYRQHLARVLTRRALEHQTG